MWIRGRVRIVSAIFAVWFPAISCGKAMTVDHTSSESGAPTYDDATSQDGRGGSDSASASDATPNADTSSLGAPDATDGAYPDDEQAGDAVGDVDTVPSCPDGCMATLTCVGGGPLDGSGGMGGICCPPGKGLSCECPTGIIVPNQCLLRQVGGGLSDALPVLLCCPCPGCPAP